MARLRCGYNAEPLCVKDSGVQHYFSPEFVRLSVGANYINTKLITS